MIFERAELKRYARQIIVPDIGIEGQALLKQARIAVIGGGGLGCPVLQYLNAAGIGTIGIIDADTVSVSNLHRQILYTDADEGSVKVIAAAERLTTQNPFNKIITHHVAIDSNNAASLLSDYDIIVDGCDNFATRYIVNDACVLLNKPLVYGSILGYEGQLAVFNYKGSKQLRDLFPEAPDAADVPDCSENGVLGTVPGIIGTIMAQMAISVVLGHNTYHNQFILFHTRTLERRILAF